MEARVDGAAQEIQSKPARKPVQNVVSVRSRPLVGKSFFLDLPSGKTLEFLEKSVKRFGGVVESFLSKEVTCLVSNNQEAGKESWGRKPTAAVLRNAQAGTQTSVGLGKGHGDPSYKPTDAVLVTRGKALLQKAIGTQSNTCGSNSVLASAQSWGIQIMHTDDMFSYLQWLDSKRCRSTRQMKPFRSRPQSALKVMRLQPPFLKVEDESRRLRPFLQRFKNFPELCFPERRGQGPFDPPRSPASSKTPEGRPGHSGTSSDCCLLPRRQRGYCECCEETFVELQMHLQSARHTAFALDASHYAPVDRLISQMTSVFAGPSGSPPPPRVPPATSGDHSGFQEAVLQGTVVSSGQPQQSCLSGKSSDGGSSAPLPEDPSLWQWMELLGETPHTLVLPTSQSLQPLPGQAGGGRSGTDHYGRGGAAAPLKPTAALEAGSWPTSQQKTRAPPAPLPPQPGKRKRSCSPRGQVKKRPALTGRLLSQPPPDTNALPGTHPAGTTDGSFSRECGSQTSPGCLRLSAVPVTKARQGLHAPPTQFPPEGPAWPPRELARPETGCLQQPGQLRGREEGSAARPSQEGHTQAPCKSHGMDARLGPPDSPPGTGTPSLLPSPPSLGGGPSQFTEAVSPKWPLSLGLAPLPCSAEPSSSSSSSEWDKPLLCALEGPSRFPFGHPVDSALLGTCVSVRDSGYESHLCSVLWQTLEPHEARQGDARGCHGLREGLWTPFSSLGASLSS